MCKMNWNKDAAKDRRELNGDSCVHCFILWTHGAEWRASGVSTLFTFVGEMRGRTMQCGEETQGDRWVW